MTQATLIAFDFDGTLTQRDTFLEFIKFSKGVWKMRFGVLIFAPLLVAMKLKLRSNAYVKQKMFSFFYKGVSLDTFNRWGIEFSAVIRRTVYAKAMETLKAHQAHGDKTIIISASIENWIKPWAEQNGIETVLSTKIETDANNTLTGRFATPNCYGQEKVNRLLTEFPNRHAYRLIAYGDSLGDKALLEFADEGYLNKSGAQYLSHFHNSL